MKPGVVIFVIFLALGASFAQTDSIPMAIHYQGQLREGDIRYEGTGIFRFAIIDNSSPAPLILWSNDGSGIGSPATTAPTNGVTLDVSKGLFQVALGDESLTNMTAIPGSVFKDNPFIYLRVWFQKDAQSTLELMIPDARLLTVPFSYRSGSINGSDIDDSSIPMGKLARESVGPEHAGRSNTIKSVYFDISSTGNSNVIYDVPDGKTFVLTDIFISSADKGTLWTITDDPSSQLKQYYKLQIDARLADSLQNWSHSFKAGLRFAAPRVVAVFPESAPQSMRIRGTISGFEF